MFYVEVPSQYQKVQKRTVKATAHQRRYDDLDTIVFKQVVEIKPLKTTTYDILPQYEKIFLKTHPHTYYSEWREFLCSGGYRGPTARDIQKALKQRGYYQGTIDEVIGDKTKAAILRFQKERHLPTGHLNCETLKALGLSCD